MKTPIKERAKQILAKKNVTGETLRNFDAVEASRIVSYMFAVLRHEKYSTRELTSLEALFEAESTVPMHACGKAAKHHRRNR